MKKLTLIRHAKSSWEGNFRDFDRPLSNRGLKDASNMIKKITEFNLSPDLVISSPANRALTTAKLFMNELNINNDIFHTNDQLYDFSGQMLLETIKSIKKEVNYVLLFGHNHAITYFVNAFGDIPIDNVPTCGLVTIEFSIDQWDDLKKGTTSFTLFPKSLRE